MIKFFLLIFALSSCSQSFSVAEPIYSADKYSLSCQQIQQKIIALDGRKIEVRKNDKFMLRHMMVLPAIISVMKMNKETKKIDKELNDLRSLKRSKNCQGPSSQKTTKPKAYNPLNNSYQAPRNSNYMSDYYSYHNGYDYENIYSNSGYGGDSRSSNNNVQRTTQPSQNAQQQRRSDDGYPEPSYLDDTEPYKSFTMPAQNPFGKIIGGQQDSPF